MVNTAIYDDIVENYHSSITRHLQRFEQSVQKVADDVERIASDRGRGSAGEKPAHEGHKQRDARVKNVRQRTGDGGDSTERGETIRRRSSVAARRRGGIQSVMR